MRHGFSLVELSIVLVILGLLTGGILAGQSLIRASEMRAVTVERDRYTTAVYAFRDKYFALPGDFANAYTFWGAAAGCTNASAAPGAGGETGCNGDGNGRINNWIGEGQRFWWMLQMAGLVEGSYNAGATVTTLVLGTHVPRSKLNNAGWSTQTSVFTSGPMGWGAYSPDGNWLMFGGASGGNPTINIALKPEEAWNIDTKADDGKPGQGKIFGGDAYIGGGNFANRCVTARSAAGDYDLVGTAVTCNLGFLY